MKWSFTSVGLIVFGLIGITIILLFNQITTSNESDYYLLKEITNAAMIDSIDMSYYRETGDLKIVKEKFVENFTRRYSESTLFIGTKHIINFYDIMETPPKVTILIDTGLGQYRIFNNVDDYNVQNALTGILEYTGKNTFATPGSGKYNNPYENNIITKTYYSMPAIKDGSVSVTEAVNIPAELNWPNIKNIKINNITYRGIVNTQSELGMALLKRELDYKRALNTDNRTDYSYSVDNLANKIENIKMIYDNCNGNKKIDGSDCEYNPYWISWSGKTSSEKKAIAIKYELEWSYEEYKYAS